MDAADAAVVGISLEHESIAHGRLEGVRARFGLPASVAKLTTLPDGRLSVEASSPTARVVLPARANDAVELEDRKSHLRVRFALVGATSAPFSADAGFALAPHALQGADVLHRPSAEGTEDYVAFASKPEREELTYRVDVTSVAGLRLIDGQLEMLDAGGAPRLRVNSPYLVDAHGVRQPAKLVVEGCAVDTSVVAPWGRAIPAPGADSCIVRVTWSDVDYPVLVDPAWTATSNMAVARADHTATLLKTGKVLVVGGSTSTATELYDETSGTFAGAGSISAQRVHHTASLLPSGKVLIAGGGSILLTGSIYASGQVYDPATGWGPILPMKSPRRYPAAAVLGSGQVLITGGQDTLTNTLSTAEIFDGTAFVTATSMPEARRSHTATTLASGKVLIAGGGASATLRNAWITDGASYTTTGSTPTDATGRAALLPSGKVFFTARTVVGTTNTFGGMLFDGTSTFTSIPGTLPQPPAAVAGLKGGGVLIVMGASTGSQKVALFDGSATYLAQPDALSNSLGSKLTLLASGRVLQTGGGTSGLTNANLFNLLVGEACTTSSQCANGLCDGGYCCAAACTTCQACAAGTGACVAVKSADDADTCTGTSTCSAAGACLPKNGQPTPTAGASGCASGFAANGVCCDTACASACDSCAVAGSVGTCTVTPKAVGTPSCSPFLCGSAAGCPTSCTSDSDCVATAFCGGGVCVLKKAVGQACPSGNHECSNNQCVDGMCCNSACASNCMACSAAKSGGADGVCSFVVSGGVGRGECGAQTCVSSTVTTPVCNGGGSCTTTTKSCLPSSCNTAGTACQSSCTTDAECGAGNYCNPTLKECAPKKARAVVCASNTECTSGACADGLCCDNACNGQCEACAEPGSEGTCMTVKGKPRAPRELCAGGGTECGGACDGKNAAVCSFPNLETTCGAGCKDGAIAQCDGAGACRSPKTCLGDLSCDGTTACKTRCAGDTDCRSGFSCDKSSGTCVPQIVATCSADNTQSIPADGTPKDCAPYRCGTTGACLQNCATTTDCANGFQCDTSAGGLCVAVQAGDSGGCSYGGAPLSTGAALAALAALVGALGRRRRTARRV